MDQIFNISDDQQDVISKTYPKLCYECGLFWRELQDTLPDIPFL